MSLTRTVARRALHSRLLVSSAAPLITTSLPHFTLTHRLLTSSHPPVHHYATSSSYSPVGPYPSTVKRPINYGICIVPQQSAWVIERFGKFHRILSPGLHFLIPLVDRIAYIHSLKEQAIPISNQQAITMDNVTVSPAASHTLAHTRTHKNCCHTSHRLLTVLYAVCCVGQINIDGVLYLRINNPEHASYGVNDIYYAMTQLAQTTMRSELGKITLDQTFANRESLNANIVNSINSAATPWGVQCLRYEIRDITPPASVKYAMDMQAEAERKKRATILDSEGSQQSEINVANGARQATILAAQGEAAAILAKAEATAKGINMLAESIGRRGGKEAVGLRIAEQYVEAFGQIAQKGNTMLLPSGMNDPSGMIAQALAIYGQVVNKTGGSTTGSGEMEGGASGRRESEGEGRQMGSGGVSASTYAANATSQQSPTSYFSSAMSNPQYTPPPQSQHSNHTTSRSANK